MAEPQDDYFDRVYAESSEEDRKVLDQGTPDFFRELKYGFERATFMGADIARLAEAETSGKTIQEIEAERLGRIEARYSDLPKASKESYTALGGELLGEVLDPTLIGLGPLGFAAKGTKLGKLGQRVYSSVYGGGLYGSDAAIDMAARGEDISATGVTVGALAGTLGGAFIKPVVKKSTSEAPATIKLETTADDAFSLPITQVSDEQEVAIKKVFADVDASNPSIMESLADLPNMGARVAKARETRLRYKEEYANRKAKRAGALSKDELAKLRKERDAAREDMRTLPTEMMRNSEIISDAFLESATRLDKQGLLNENTIGRIVTRPLIGAGIGYGLGVTNQAITGEEDSLSPMWFVTAGLIGGQLSKKIMNSKFSTSVKEEGLKSLEELNNRSLAAQANLLFSGTTAARLNTLGDDVSAFGRTLLAQRGADLKGAATVSVEEAKDIAAQELNNVFSKSMMGLGVLGKDNDEIRKAAWKYSEGFADEATLLSRGFSKAEVETVKQLSDEAKAIVSSVTNEAASVGLQFLKLEDYALPQLHDFAKIGADLDTAKAAYRRAFIKQARADRVSATLLKDPNADVSKINLSEKQIGAASDAADKWVMDAATLGLPGGRVKSAWQAKTPAEREMFNTRLTPLADHFEKDRVIKDLEARREIQDFLVQDVAEIIPQYVDNSMPIIEFGRAFGSRGEVIFELKKAINTEAEAAKRAAKGDKRLYVLADKVRRNKIKAIHDSVEMYFGTYQASNRLASSGAATNALGLLTTLGNTTMLTKVTLDSMGDMVQPFVNSGFWNSIKGMKRTNSKEMTDFAESTGFAQRDVLSQELRSLMLDRNNALSVTQRGIAKSNEIFFKTIGLAKLTSYARRFAYNTGIEDAFNIAQDVAKKGMTKTNLNKAKALGLSDDAISTLQRFKNVDEAFDDVDGKKILNIAGIKTADRDVLIPQVGNRLGFTQSKDPLIRSLGQFLSWAQAKTTQTNAIVQRIEDGDVALGVRALGSLVVYDGIMTFKQYLNDPTGKYLPDEVDSYVEKLITPEQLGSSVIQGGFSPFYAQKAASLIFTPYGSTVTSNISPTISLMEDLGELVFESTPRNLEQEDYEGLALQYLKRIPFGKEVEDILAVTGNELEDVGKQSKGKATESSFVPLYNKGGEVLDVPNVPTEPDQRIDKMTGLPYDQQAGTAFVDEEDPLRRLGFKGGGQVDPLSRLGFGLGSLVSKGFAKLTDDAADVSEEAFKKEMDDLAGAIDKGETPKMFQGTLAVQHASSEKKLKEFIDPSEVKPSARYPENEFGDNAVYFGEKDSPFTATEGMYGYEPSPYLYNVDAVFDKAFVLTPKNVKELASLVPEDKRRFGGDVATVLKDKGYDGLIIRGFDDSTAAQEAVSKAEKNDKFFYGIFQDQVVSFDPKKNKILGDPEVRSGVEGRDREIAINMKEEDIAAWQEANKLPESKRQKQRPEVIQSLQRVLAGKKTIEEHNKLIDEVFPPYFYTKENAPEFPTLVEVRGAVGKKTLTGGRGIIDADVFVEEGRRVSSRLDIPAYDQRGVWAVTLHEPGKGGKAFAYGQSAILKNVEFTTNPKDALDIAVGQAKGTIARIEGDWINHNSRKTYTEALDLLDSNEWVQVGMNPYKHSYFYDKETMKPLKSASEIIQVGPLVLAKKDKKLIYAEADDFKVDLSSESIKGKKKLREQEINIDSVSFMEGGKVLKALTRKKYSFGNEVRADMRRADGSVKSSRGFLGPVENTVQGGTMTEVSIGTEINGKEMEIPTMVPTLTKDEVKALSSMKLEGNAKSIPESIIMKAKEHARMRLEQGKSPFYQDGE